jgi:hypothetical protein
VCLLTLMSSISHYTAEAFTTDRRAPISNRSELSGHAPGTCGTACGVWIMRSSPNAWAFHLGHQTGYLYME